MGGFLSKPSKFGGPLYDPLRDKVFGGGGGNDQAKAIDSLPVPLPAPPVTAANAEVLQAEQDYAKQQLNKKSVKSTIHAGETGGYKLPKMGMFGPIG